MHLRQAFSEYFFITHKVAYSIVYTSSFNVLQYNDVETIAEIDLKALYIMDLLKFEVKHTVVKLQMLAGVGIRAEMQFLACFVSLGKYSVLRMRILNFALGTIA